MIYVAILFQDRHQQSDQSCHLINVINNFIHWPIRTINIPENTRGEPKARQASNADNGEKF